MTTKDAATTESFGLHERVLAEILQKKQQEEDERVVERAMYEEKIGAIETRFNMLQLQVNEIHDGLNTNVLKMNEFTTKANEAFSVAKSTQSMIAKLMKKIEKDEAEAVQDVEPG